VTVLLPDRDANLLFSFHKQKGIEVFFEKIACSVFLWNIYAESRLKKGNNYSNMNNFKKHI
jgi:hypothetical protein